MTELLPLFPLNTVLFPGMPLPLHIFEERYRRMLRARVREEIPFGVALITAGSATGGPVGFHPVGTAARLVSKRTYQDGRADIVISGTERFRVSAADWQAGYCVAEIEYLAETAGNETEVVRLLAQASQVFRRYVEGISRLTGRQFTGVTIDPDPVVASWDLAARLPLHTWERQRILESDTVEERLRALNGLIRREVRLLYQGGAAGLAINHPGGRFSAN